MGLSFVNLFSSVLNVFFSQYVFFLRSLKWQDIDGQITLYASHKVKYSFTAFMPVQLYGTFICISSSTNNNKHQSKPLFHRSAFLLFSFLMNNSVILFQMLSMFKNDKRHLISMLRPLYYYLFLTYFDIPSHLQHALHMQMFLTLYFFAESVLSFLCQDFIKRVSEKLGAHWQKLSVSLSQILSLLWCSNKCIAKGCSLNIVFFLQNFGFF